MGAYSTTQCLIFGPITCGEVEEDGPIRTVGVTTRMLTECDLTADCTAAMSGRAGACGTVWA